MNQTTKAHNKMIKAKAHTLALAGLIALAATSAQAAPKRSHGAHKHGEFKVEITVVETEAKVSIESDTESILGFEHEAKTPEQKAKVEQVTSDFKKKIGEWIQFDSTLGCVYTPNEVTFHADGSHRDLDASYSVKCQSTPVGSTLTIQIGSVFPSVKHAEIKALIGDQAFKKEVSAKGGTLVLGTK